MVKEDDELRAALKKKIAESYGLFDVNKEDKKPLLDDGMAVSSNRLACTYLLFAFAIVCLVNSVACVQILAGTVPEFELNGLRFFALALISLPGMILRGSYTIPRTKWGWTAGVYITITAFNLTYYLAAKYVAAGAVAGLNSTVTIIGSSILTLCIKAERKLYLYISTLVCLTGILFLLQPSPIFGAANLYKAPAPNWTSPCQLRTNMTTEQEQQQQAVGDDDSTRRYFGYALLLCSGTTMVAAFRFIRRVIDDVSPFTLCFYLGVICGMACMVVMLIFEIPTFPSSSLCTSLTLVNCFGVAIYLLLVPYCLQYIEPPMLILMRSTDLLLLLILQHTLLQDIQPGKGNWLEILGGVICFLGCCLGPLWQLVTLRRRSLIQINPI